MAGRLPALVASVAAVLFTVAPLAGVAAAAPPPAQDTTAFCKNVPASNPFTDVPASKHHDNVLCLAAAGITKGKTATTYDPSGTVTRGQMATFVARTLDEAIKLKTGSTALQVLPVYDGTNRFNDVSNSDVHVGNINRLAKAGIVQGTGGGAYSPLDPVSRAQMATFINNSEKFLTGTAFSTSQDFFTDDNGTTHEANINAIASVGIAQGVSTDTYAPGNPVLRDQMASFLIRWLAVEHAAGHIKPLPAAGPDLQGASANDADRNGVLSQGDSIVLTFANPIAVSSSLRLKDVDNTVATLTDESPTPAGSTTATFTLDSEKKVLTVTVTGPVTATGGDGVLKGAITITGASGITDATSGTEWDPTADQTTDVTFTFAQPGIVVTPVDTANPHFSSSTTTNEGARTCTAAVAPDVTAVDIALFPASALSTDLAGKPVFFDTDGNQAADLTVDAAGGVIESANSATNPANPDTNYLDNVSVVNGAVSFVIDSTTADLTKRVDVVAVVFADKNTDNKLNLTGSGTTPKPPSEVFGVGCHTRWTPDEYHPGPIVGMATVKYVDKVENLFVGTTSDSADPGSTFFYSPSDQLSVGSSSPDADAFEAAISPGDTVQGSYRLNPSAPSQLSLTDSAPLAPTPLQGAEHGTTIRLSWTPSTTPNTDSVAIFRCAGTGCSTFSKLATVPAWMTSYDDTNLTVDTSYSYKFRAVDEGDESADSSSTVTTTARATDEPLINQARVTKDASLDGIANAGDEHTFVFSEPMSSSITASGSTYQVRDADGTVVNISCGSGTTCVLSSDSRTLTVTLGTLPAPIQPGTTAGLKYPVTVTGVGAGWADQGGTALDLASSPDTVLDVDNTPPTISDVRATVDGTPTGFSGPSDTHRFIFSERMAPPTIGANGTRYNVTGANTFTDVVACNAASDCLLNAAPVTIGGVTYEAGRVLTVSVSSGTNLATYPLTITSVTKLTDATGNPVNLAGSPDKTIEVAP
ncbi:MAG: hypothetical protein QOC92_343 [Acidimicrobiaceae bacterium]